MMHALWWPFVFPKDEIHSLKTQKWETETYHFSRQQNKSPRTFGFLKSESEQNKSPRTFGFLKSESEQNKSRRTFGFLKSESER
jgi:hypothetical protein